MAVQRGIGVGVAAAVATELFYGFSFVFTKTATGRISALDLLAWRFAVALAAMLVLVALRAVRLRITKGTLTSLLLLALFQPILYYVGETLGVMRTTASESGLIISAIPVVTLLCSWLLIGARPSGHQVAGILTTLVGVALTVIAGGLTAQFDAVGYLFLVLAVVAYSLYAVFVERHSHTTEIDKTFVMIAVGAVSFVLLAALDHARAGTLDAFLRLPVTHAGLWVAVLYLALGSSIGAFFLQNVAIRIMGSNRYATFIGISALAAVLSGAIALHERIGALQIVGGVFILAGVYIANRRPVVQAAP